MSEKIIKYSIENEFLKLTVLNYGSRVYRIFNKREKKDMVLFYKDLEDYLIDKNYLGATIGPNAGRIKGNSFNIGSKKYVFNKNDDDNNLHSGGVGVDKEIWKTKVIGNRIISTFTSYFPFYCLYRSTFCLEDNSICIKNECIPNEQMLINMTNHSYFTLGKENISDLKIKLNADLYMPNTDNLIPTGEVLSVNDTKFDFKKYSSVNDKNKFDYDVTFVRYDDAFDKVASIKSDDTLLEIYSDSCCFYFYTGDHIMIDDKILKNTALCIEPQFAPNFINYKFLRQAIFNKNEHFIQKIQYKFSKLVD